MEPKTICQWCGSAAGAVVREIMSSCRGIKKFVQKLCRRDPSGLPKIEIEEPESVEEIPVETVSPEKPIEEENDN